MRKMTIVAVMSGAALLAGGFVASATASTTPSPVAPAQQTDLNDECGGVGETGLQHNSGPAAVTQGTAHKLIRLDGKAGGACAGDGAAAGAGAVGETSKAAGQGAARTAR